MIDLVKKYISAWEEANIEKALSTLHKNFKGIRTYFEEIIFDEYGLDAAMDNPVKLSYDLKNIQEFDTYLTMDATLTMNKRIHEVTFKFIFQDNLIYKVYETAKLVDKKRVKCIIAYDGSMFSGYQIQPDETTIQGDIEKALKDALNEDITIHASGRTDKGVHAYNQIIHFDTASKIPGENILKVLNKHLPDSIHIKHTSDVHDTFHSRFDILSKEYVYHINLEEYNVIQRDYEWSTGEFDHVKFRDELLTLLGRHDFTAFTKTQKTDNYRVIYDIRFEEIGHLLKVYIKGNGFLRYMVRNIIGYAMSIAKGETSDTLLSIIDSKDNSLVKSIAPAGGLYMNEVLYNE